MPQRRRVDAAGGGGWRRFGGGVGRRLGCGGKRRTGDVGPRGSPGGRDLWPRRRRPSGLGLPQRNPPPRCCPGRDTRPGLRLGRRLSTGPPGPAEANFSPGDGATPPSSLLAPVSSGPPAAHSGSPRYSIQSPRTASSVCSRPIPSIFRPHHHRASRQSACRCLTPLARCRRRWCPPSSWGGGAPRKAIVVTPQDLGLDLDSTLGFTSRSA